MSQISISSDSKIQQEEEEFIIEEIKEKRMRNGLPEYLIKWQGFDSNQNTWEPLSNLKYVAQMVQEFEYNLERQLSKKRPSKQQKQQSSQSPSPQKIKKSKRSQSPSVVAKQVIQEEIKMNDQFQGSYEDNDSAKEILNIRKDNENKTLEFQVAWKQRKSTKTPQPTWMADNLLKLHNPEVLSDFLLKKIKWPKSGTNV